MVLPGDGREAPEIGDYVPTGATDSSGTIRAGNGFSGPLWPRIIAPMLPRDRGTKRTLPLTEQRPWFRTLAGRVVIPARLFISTTLRMKESSHAARSKARRHAGL